MNTYTIVYFDNDTYKMHNYTTEAKNKIDASLNFYKDYSGLGVIVNIIDFGKTK